MGIMIIPWTINEVADMEAMKKFNLDGIITDYPDRALRIFGPTPGSRTISRG
jgi:glycerophosphoryl diester phosphodiesterase